MLPRPDAILPPEFCNAVGFAAFGGELTGDLPMQPAAVLAWAEAQKEVRDAA